MIDSMIPDRSQSIRVLVDSDGARSASASPRRQRQMRDRQMCERRTAMLMLAFGLVLGGLELFIVLSYI